MTRRSVICVCLAIAGVCLVGLSACRGDDDTESQTLSVVVREGLEADGLRRVAEEWGRSRRVSVVVDALGRANYEVVAKQALLSSKPAYDVVFFPGTMVAEMAEKGALSPINHWSHTEDSDLLAFSSFEDVVYGLPCDISTFFTFYRSDVVDQAPDTWDELLAMAPSWASFSNARSTTTYGLAFAGQAGEELPKIFYPMLWSYGGYVIEDGVVGLDTDEAVAAADMLRRLASSRAAPAEIETWNVMRILDELQAGTVALSTPQWNALYPLIVGGTSSVANSIAISDVPGVRQADGSVRRVNFKHTWVLVKPRRGLRNELANDFVLYATGKEGARLYALTARGNPARRSILSDPELQQERAEFPLMLRTLENAKAEPEVPYYSELHEVMNTALSRILAGSAGPREAMQDAAKRARELVAGNPAR